MHASWIDDNDGDYDVGYSNISDGCRVCRMGFDENQQPIFAEIKSDGKWFKCVNCNGSYGPVLTQ